MKRFRKQKSSSKAVETVNADGTTSVPVKDKKKKSFLSIFSRKKKVKSSSKDVVSGGQERSGAELAVEDKDGPPPNSSNQLIMEVMAERSTMKQQETSKLPPGAKSEEPAAFDFFFATESPDGSISSGFHEVHTSTGQSDTLSEPSHRHLADARLSFPVGSHSSKLYQGASFQENVAQGIANDHRCVTTSQSCITGMKSDSNTLLLHPPVRTVPVHCCKRKDASDRTDGVQRDNSAEECNTEFGPATRLWIGQAHPVTFADGTTRIVSWSFVGGQIVGSVVDDDGNEKTNSPDSDLPIQEDQSIYGQSKYGNMEDQDSRMDVPENTHGEDSQTMPYPSKTSTCNFPQAREPYHVEDSSESVASEIPEIKQTFESNTSSDASVQKNSKTKTQSTYLEGRSSAGSLDSLNQVRCQENVSSSHLDVARAFAIESHLGVKDATENSATEELFTSRHPSERCDPVQARLKRRDDSSADGDTSSVFSADAGVTERFLGMRNEHSKSALHKCNSSDAVLAAKTKTNRAIWCDISNERSDEISPEVDRILGSVSSVFSRKSLSEVVKPDEGPTLGASKANCVSGGRLSSSSIQNLNASKSKTYDSKSGSISSPAVSANNARWKSVTDLTRSGSRSTSDANIRTTPSVYDPQVAAELAKKFAAINTRFRTMAAEAIARRESGNHLFKGTNQGQSNRPLTEAQSRQPGFEDGDSGTADLSWKFDGISKHHINDPDRNGLDVGRPITTKGRTGSIIANDSADETGESPLVSATLAVSQTKGAVDYRDTPTEDRKYSSESDLRFRFSKDTVSFPSSNSQFSNSLSSHGPSSAVNDEGRLTGAVRRPVQGTLADETPAANRPRKKTLHEQMEEIRSQVNQWHKDLTLNSRLRYTHVFDNSE